MQLPQNLLQSLNKAQREAVEYTRGRLLILAGAGSGKTKVLTTRMSYLILQCGVNPEAILGLTFTNKAAGEMRTRLESFVGKKIGKKVMLSTFHSFCLYVLRREARHLGYTENFLLYDRQDVMRKMDDIAKELLDHEGHLPSLLKTYELIGLMKNKGLSEATGTGSPWHDDFVTQMMRRLNDSFRAYNAMDFDHMLWLVKELFEQHPDVLARYQERFQYVLIDEYQDTSPVQARVAELLTEKSRNLCVVGDDDQSIYSWRGADVQNILKFEDAKVVKLEQNFRSTNTILKAANLVIGKNVKRHKKQLWSDKGEGGLIQLFHAPNETLEAETIIDRMIKMRERHGLKWGDFAVLYRSNALARPIESAIIRKKLLIQNPDGTSQYKQIPYQVYGGDEFYEHKEIKDLIGYLRVMANERDHEAHLRIINYPRRGIGEAALDQLTQRHRTYHIPLWELFSSPDTVAALSEKAQAGIASYIKLIQWGRQRFTEIPFADALRELVDRLQFKKVLFEEVKSDLLRKIKLENVEELSSALAEYQKMSENPSLLDFVTSTVLDADRNHWQSKEDKEGDHVHLMTFHSAKGLEFPACFLIGAEDHLIPHEKSTSESAVEEERRLLYVAMTRAEQHLTVSMATCRRRLGSETPSKPSRFLFDIDKGLYNVAKWDATF